ncbi:alcohol dehydrogenase catalytic domain-containing protein [Candidatus Calescamantes bacterium]|nr:alcohol dehydrogenase catalytic domain-containing protein [Candidatus Calescamantes bacterium]
MQAVVIGGINKVALRDVEEPTLTPDRILVKIKAATICNSTDPSIIKGFVPSEPLQRSSPSIPGNKGAGEVVGVGEKVSGFERGDRFHFVLGNLELLVNLVKSTFPNICWGALGGWAFDSSVC